MGNFETEISLPTPLKKCFIYLFLQKGEGKEKERERNNNVWLPLAIPILEAWPPTQACALTENHTGDILVPSLVLSQLSHTSQGSLLILKCHTCV